MILMVIGLVLVVLSLSLLIPAVKNFLSDKITFVEINQVRDVDAYVALAFGLSFFFGLGVLFVALLVIAVIWLSVVFDKSQMSLLNHYSVLQKLQFLKSYPQLNWVMAFLMCFVSIVLLIQQNSDSQKNKTTTSSASTETQKSTSEQTTSNQAKNDSKKLFTVLYVCESNYPPNDGHQGTFIRNLSSAIDTMERYLEQDKARGTHMADGLDFVGEFLYNNSDKQSSASCREDYSTITLDTDGLRLQKMKNGLYLYEPSNTSAMLISEGG